MTDRDQSRCKECGVRCVVGFSRNPEVRSGIATTTGVLCAGCATAEQNDRPPRPGMTVEERRKIMRRQHAQKVPRFEEG